MSNQTLLVVVNANGGIIAVADPARVPHGMSFTIASNKPHAVHEVHVPDGLMQRPHPEMKRIILERIKAPGMCKPHIARRKKSPAA
jgi:hypothetical protein